MKYLFFLIIILNSFLLFPQNRSAIIKKLAKAEKIYLKNEDENFLSLLQKYTSYLTPNQMHYLAHCAAAEFCHHANINYINRHYYLQLAAEGGIECAQINLAYNYEFGNDVEKDLSKAAYWYEKVAHSTNAQIQFIIANKYLEGAIFPQDISKGITLLEKSAKQNNPDAQNALGIIYHFGIHVSKNDSMAKYYFELSANKATQDIFYGKNEKDSSMILWFPREVDISKNILLLEQLKFAKHFFADTNQKIVLTSGGNNGYDTQYLSWKNVTSLRDYIIQEYHFPLEKIIIQYGYNYLDYYTTIRFANTDEEGRSLLPPPTGGLLNHRYDICGFAHFAP